MRLQQEFDTLARCSEELIALLQESDQEFWAMYLQRGLANVRQHKLAGATYVLGCFTGQGSMSDLVLAAHLQDTEPLVYRNLNARLGHLRTRVFESAKKIASRQLW